VPDGQRILVISDRDGNDEVYGMTPSGSEQTNLTNSPGDDVLLIVFEAN
jgi:Tol biopolymer transport system component